MLKTCMIEVCPDSDAGSIGAFYVAHHARKSGHIVDELRTTKSGYDVEMISVHHCTDFIRLSKLKKRAKYRIVGGHPMQNNPRPIIKYADAVFVGEAESHIGNSLNLIEQFGIEGLRNQPGWIISKDWKHGNEIPETQIENPLPDNPSYLNRPNTRSAAWYLEIVRGCPYKCNYCELGHSSKYRVYPEDHLIKKINELDISKTRKINFYAPDESSHPQLNNLFSYLRQKGYSSGFSSMRLESVMKKKPDLKMNALIRIGIDGLSESIRKQINKPTKNEQIVEYFKYWIDHGHVQFKMFMMFGYPFETLKDFDEFDYLMKMIMRIPLMKNISLRIKWTPFIPQPCTPFKNLYSIYDYDLVDKINMWHGMYKRPRSEPGIFIENDGMMNEKNHRLQCILTSGDEDILDEGNLDKKYTEYLLRDRNIYK